jgi:hypothetical protein
VLYQLSYISPLNLKTSFELSAVSFQLYLAGANRILSFLRRKN